MSERYDHVVQITRELLESLLWEEEGATLDFKEEQYRFANAPDDDKAELLKDILAFANSFRRADAFILLGVEEVKGGRSNVVGVAEQLEDSHLQQFVRSNTNRPIDFAYRAAELDGKPVGVIHIPLQPRPVYATRDVGKVKKGVVYLRRGSSTGVAIPEEIARMGIDQAAIVQAVPVLQLRLGNRETGETSPLVTHIDTTFLRMSADEQIPDYQRSGPFEMLTPANPSYYRDLVFFTQVRNLVAPITLVLENTGEVPALDVHVKIELPDEAGELYLIDDAHYPELPRRESELHRIVNTKLAIGSDVNVKSIGTSWVVSATFGKVQPGATVWLRDDFYIGAKSSGPRTRTLPVQVFGDNLPKPVLFEIETTFETRVVDATLETIKKIELERYRNSPEGRRMMERMRKDQRSE